MNNIAVIPGSYDPISNGHISIINAALEIFDQVIVAIGSNSRKKPFIPVEDRIELINQLNFPKKIMVCSFDGLLSDFCKKCKATIIIRGLRSITDFEYELEVARVNADLNPKLQTIFIPADPNISMVSSSVIKEICGNDGIIPEKYAPLCVVEYLNNRKKKMLDFLDEAERKFGVSF